MVALIVVITIWGISNSVLMESALRSILVRQSLSADDINAIGRKFTLISTGLTLAGILIFLVVAIFFSRIIASPIKILTEAVISLDKGKEKVKISLTSDDEFGQLASAFNMMVDDLEKTTVSRDYMNTIINSMNDSLVVLTTTGSIAAINRAFTEMVGYDDAEVLGQDFSCICEMDVTSDLSRESYSAETAYRNKSGNLIPVFMSRSIMKDEEGMVQGIVCAAQDIHILKEAQKALHEKHLQLEEMNRNLEVAVQARTHELKQKNEELRAENQERARLEAESKVAKEIAEIANQAKTNFLAHMSHEIRTPLNTIIGIADVIKETPLSVEQHKYVTLLQRSGEHLLTMVNDILDLSKVELGKLTLEETPFNLRELMQYTVELFSAQAHQKRVGLEQVFSGEIPLFVQSDPHRIRQILLNLLGNAFKFTDEGSVTVGLTCTNNDGEQVTAHFFVRDTGIGIPQEKVESIFEVFTQADISITRKYGGTGLGLPIAKKLAEAMGGHIWVESRVGQGSSFHVEIPLKVAKGDQPVRMEWEEPKIPDTISSSLRILVVDDSIENRMLISLYLKESHHRLEMAETGEEAFRFFTTGGAFDLVLMDMQMPIMDGFSATRAIRSWEVATGRVSTPIVALTAYAREEDVARTREAGCSAHLTKPLKKAALLTTITELISKEDAGYGHSHERRSAEG